ncbi:CheR family methyltransferase [Marinospirillum alkaliphilum]|uniref:Chemotaxis protein methyltransferase CheR n=1 Tax=Marinospirillum alkaliphilum DSM 21637 TaxID=1122209 RepID=A0A1K1XTA8_9GAMM|nr:protein-glutamate O-methyltransferase CheR [Marinospirillum alkaliphilum]SFX52260.1 chemotaxis protein methyltransferase CheR [Marinospirillum alkaliphilum DSM 21637]
MSQELASFKKLIHEHCGLLLEGIAEERLRKALQKSAQQAGCTGLVDYEKLIRRDAEQFDRLISLLTVNETYFFREPEQIQLCIRELVPRLLALPGRNGPLRILSAGCSSGEEPYSLVMALREKFGERASQLFHVDAGDLDRQILEKARMGIYSPFSFRGVEESLRNRYFQPVERGYQLSADIRRLVHFHELNLLAPVFPAMLRNYDLIFFRNVSIYFDLETRKLIHRKFFDLLKPQGILLLGSSETLGNDLGVFELVEEQGQYYFIKGDVLRPVNSQAVSWRPASREVQQPVVAAPVVKAPTVTEMPVTAKPVFSPPLPDLQKVRQLVLDEQYEKALQQLDRLLSASYERSAALLLKSWILLSRKAFPEADQLLNLVLEQDPWSVDALLMKGMSCKWQLQQEQALEWFKKASYTCPECWTAHYNLAEIYRQMDNTAAAMRAYQAVRRILSSDRAAGDGSAWIPRLLPPGDTLFLAERQLLKLKETGMLAGHSSAPGGKDV